MKCFIILKQIYDFVKRRFGQDLADFAIDPMVRGICAGNAKEISAGVLKCDVTQVLVCCLIAKGFTKI